jgi:putative hemolysin
VPKEGDIVEWDRFRFEVMDMDWRRVDKVLLTPLSSFGGPPEEGR